ncbi:hypothetical protein HY837_06260 [archaeon]|nr:hypothetical protein [archaeon]
MRNVFFGLVLLTLILLAGCKQLEKLGSCESKGGYCELAPLTQGECKTGFKSIGTSGTAGCAKSQFCCLPESK